MGFVAVVHSMRVRLSGGDLGDSVEKGGRETETVHVDAGSTFGKVRLHTSVEDSAEREMPEIVERRVSLLAS